MNNLLMLNRQNFSPLKNNGTVATDIDCTIYAALQVFQKKATTNDYMFDVVLGDIAKAYLQAQSEKTVPSFKKQLAKELQEHISFRGYKKPSVKKISK